MRLWVIHEDGEVSVVKSWSKRWSGYGKLRPITHEDKSKDNFKHDSNDAVIYLLFMISNCYPPSYLLLLAHGTARVLHRMPRGTRWIWNGQRKDGREESMGEKRLGQRIIGRYIILQFVHKPLLIVICLACNMLLLRASPSSWYFARKRNITTAFLLTKISLVQHILTPYGCRFHAAHSYTMLRASCCLTTPRKTRGMDKEQYT